MHWRNTPWRPAPCPKAVLLGSDEVAEGALEAFRELRVRVPKDVAVVIYHDIQTLESKWPTGTCIEMCLTTSGKARSTCSSAG